ncbi:MAG: peptide chain release factor 1 [Wigglesworthia glossinidia]|nr:peptide chain release factor 1 [Wigglesworthia glossinidia]
MHQLIIVKLENLSNRYKELNKILSNSNVITDKSKFLSLSKEHSRLSILEYYFNSWKKLNREKISLKSMLSDTEIHDLVQDELNVIHIKIKKIEEKIILFLMPQDFSNKYNCFLEIRAGTGGGEAALFVKDLCRMYIKFSEFQSWKIKIIHSSHSEHKGYKEVIIKICNKKAYSKLKFESGGHRVQRIPATESQGRVHTSTCTVAVMPEMSELKLPKIKSSDLRIDTFRSSGAGGQHINTTDSAIRITHVPTNTVVECQDERSQHKNKSKAMSVLLARLQTNLLKNRKKSESKIRRNLLGSGDRSDRIRTYNFTQGRITDHRLNLTIYKLDEIMEGNLDLILDPILKKYRLKDIEKFLQKQNKYGNVE